MRTSLFICLIFLCTVAFGQQPEKFANKNSIEFEIFGHGSFYSINYERLIINSNRLKTLGQIGFAFYPKSLDIMPIWIPVSINQLISFKSNHIEFGVGQILFSDQSLSGTVEYKLFGSVKIGYRYQNPNGKFLFKAAFTPVIDYWDATDKDVSGNLQTQFIPWGGLTFGYMF